MRALSIRQPYAELILRGSRKSSTAVGQGRERRAEAPDYPPFHLWTIRSRPLITFSIGEGGHDPDASVCRQ